MHRNTETQKHRNTETQKHRNTETQKHKHEQTTKSEQTRPIYKDQDAQNTRHTQMVRSRTRSMRRSRESRRSECDVRQHPDFFPLGATVRLVELDVPPEGHPESDSEGISLGAFFVRAVDAGKVDCRSTFVKVVMESVIAESTAANNVANAAANAADTPRPPRERFWLRVLARLNDADDSFLGEVANELLLPGAPPSGALIEFRPAHILSISDARAMEPLPERETPDNIRHVLSPTRRPP